MVCCGGLMATRPLLEDGMGSIPSEFTPLFSSVLANMSSEQSAA